MTTLADDFFNKGMAQCMAQGNEEGKGDVMPPRDEYLVSEQQLNLEGGV